MLSPLLLPVALHYCCSHSPVPGFVNETIYSDTIQPGWSWLPYNAKNTVLLAEGQGVNGSNATCATLSEGGAVEFQCRECSKPGYQPFAKANALQFAIRSNTKSNDPYASSTPPGELPPVKIFLMNVGADRLSCSHSNSCTHVATLMRTAAVLTMSTSHTCMQHALTLAWRGEGHLLWQADSSKQLASVCMSGPLLHSITLQLLTSTAAP